MMEATRVTREQVLEASKGMLQKQFYVVFSKPTNGIGPVMENVPVHLEHQRKIEREGILVAAGPHWTDDEKFWDGEGMFVIRASSTEQARELAAADPMHQCGARSFTVRPWLVNEGRLDLRIEFSTGKMTLD
ncbi:MULTISPECIES: YciI family protein [Cupriavidus]|nr:MULTISPECIES: YciI family protein [Cupriavidus]QYY32700.1 YciI family protein [Cupriavidus pinatubonensis]